MKGPSQKLTECLLALAVLGVFALVLLVLSAALENARYGTKSKLVARPATNAVAGNGPKPRRAVEMPPLPPETVPRARAMPALAARALPAARRPVTNILTFEYASNAWALRWDLETSSDGGRTWDVMIRGVQNDQVITNAAGNRLFRVKGIRKASELMNQ